MSHITPIVGAVAGSAALLAIIIRCGMTGGHFAPDDYLALAAAIFAVPLLACLGVACSRGLGKDIWAIPPDHIYTIFQMSWLVECFFCLSLTLTKLSFLFFLLRIFPQVGIRRRIYFFIAITSAYGIAFTAACLFCCSPVSYTWKAWDGMHKGKCININYLAWSFGVSNIALDLMILVLPIPELLKLALATRRKVYIILMFSVGLFTTIVAAIRLRSLVIFGNSQNPTYENVSAAYWAVLEDCVSIFCVCMPSLRRFLTRILPGWFPSTQSDSEQGRYANQDLSDRFTSRKPTTRGTPNFALSTFGSAGMTKTMQANVESELGEDDEAELVDSKRSGTSKEDWPRRESRGDAESGRDVDGGRSGARTPQASTQTFLG